jgi:HK97 family phage major capsid protein
VGVPDGVAGVTRPRGPLTVSAALVGDVANYCALRVKKGITLSVSNSHSTFFLEGKQAIRAEIRAALVVYRPAAFVTITGIGP